MPRPKSNSETEAIRRMTDQRLRRGALDNAPLLSGSHMDEDALAAFLEGRLSENEAAPFISHLVACGSCRRITAQLIRLESEIGAGEPQQTSNTESEPGRLRRFLADLTARVMPSEDEAVFAYHAPAEDFQRAQEAEESKEGDATQDHTEKESAD